MPQLATITISIINPTTVLSDPKSVRSSTKRPLSLGYRDQMAANFSRFGAKTPQRTSGMRSVTESHGLLKMLADPKISVTVQVQTVASARPL